MITPIHIHIRKNILIYTSSCCCCCCNELAGFMYQFKSSCSPSSLLIVHNPKIPHLLPSTMTRWYPSDVFTSPMTGLFVLLGCRSYATFSKSASKEPRVFQPRDPPVVVIVAAAAAFGPNVSHNLEPKTNKNKQKLSQSKLVQSRMLEWGFF